ncbi:MAG: hypothetical protein KAJ10_03620 [Thermodesulfovibrionia bacterium]|nr:hypothetical protein [Thermodesulfovibrionia bacterium]
MEKYRNVLMGSEMGLEVLGDILQSCHLGLPLDSDNPQSVGEYNVGVVILNKCGIFGTNTLPQVLKAFTAVTPEQEKGEGQ